MTGPTDADVERLTLVHDRLISAVELLESSDAWRAMLAVAARFHTYSANNLLLIAAQRPDATRLAGYRAWQRLGRQVRKDEHGIAIMAPVFARTEQTAEVTTAAKQDNPRPARVVVRYRAAYVYDISQTDGPPLPDVRPALLNGAAPLSLWADLLDQVEAAGYTFGYAELTPANGRTDFADRTVTLHTGLSGAQQVKTLAHELAHVQLHAPEVRPDGCDRSRAEVEAESVAYLVTAAHGMKAEDYTVPYVTGWAGGNRDLITSTAYRVISCARTMLAPADTAAPQESAPDRSVERDRGTGLAIAARDSERPGVQR